MSRRIAVQKEPSLLVSKLWPPSQICSLPAPEHKIAVHFSSFRHTFLVDRIHFISKSDCHGVHSWLLLEETFGPQWWWSPLYTVICFRIILKHPRLASINAVTDSVGWSDRSVWSLHKLWLCPFAYLWYGVEQISCKFSSLPSLYKEPDEFSLD